MCIRDRREPVQASSPTTTPPAFSMMLKSFQLGTAIGVPV